MHVDAVWSSIHAVLTVLPESGFVYFTQTWFDEHIMHATNGINIAQFGRNI